MHCHAADQPWYLEPDALAIIAGITDRPEARATNSNPGLTRGTEQDAQVIYVGPGVAALQRYWRLRFRAIDPIRPWPEARMKAVLTCANEQDVLAALFGNPAGHPALSEAEAKWAGIREAIANAATALLARAA